MGFGVFRIENSHLDFVLGPTNDYPSFVPRVTDDCLGARTQTIDQNLF